MNSDTPKEEKTGTIRNFLFGTGTTSTRLILWLIAIAMVSFVIGFGILAVSGDLPTASENKVSPFRQTAMRTPAITAIPLDGATSGEIRITLGAGELTLQGGASNDQLMEANVFSAVEMQPDFTQAMNLSKKTVTMTETADKKKEWFALHSPNSWDIRLNDNVPVTVNVNVGAGQTRLVLGSLNLDSLVVNNGAGDTEIDFDMYHGGPFQAEIHNGVGDLTLRIPRGSNTRILVHHGVGDITTNGFVQNDEMYTTSGFSPALPVNEIILMQGVGSIQLEAV